MKDLNQSAKEKKELISEKIFAYFILVRIYYALLGWLEYELWNLFCFSGTFNIDY